MSPISACPLPVDALLSKYKHTGTYTDCYSAEIPRLVTQQQYIEAFYTGGVFKVERLLLAWFLSKPSTDAQATQLSRGEVTDFAAWRVEGQTGDQLLLCDIGGRTRSWLMVEPVGAEATRLYFGSAVVARIDKASGKARMGFVFRALLGFHKLYSRVLLHAARSRLGRLP